MKRFDVMLKKAIRKLKVYPFIRQRNGELGILHTTLDKSNTNLQSCRQELESARLMLAYQQALIAGTNGNSVLHIILLPRSSLSCAWLRIEYFNANTIVFSVYHPKEYTGDYYQERLAKAAIEFDQDTANILELKVADKYQRNGIGSALIKYIEREAKVNEKLSIRYIMQDPLSLPLVEVFQFLNHNHFDHVEELPNGNVLLQKPISGWPRNALLKKA